MAKDLILLLHAGFVVDAGEVLSSPIDSELFENLSNSGAVVTSPKRTLLSDWIILGASPALIGTDCVTLAFMSLSTELTNGGDWGIEVEYDISCETRTGIVHVYGLKVPATVVKDG